MDALLDEIVANPEHDAPRAIWADRLLERGDPWGEFVQLQLASSRGDDAVHGNLAVRIRELYNEHHLRHEPVLPQDMRGKWVWRRGFIDQLSTSAADFKSLAARIFEEVPTLRTLQLDIGEAVENRAPDLERAAIAASLAAALAVPEAQRLEGLILCTWLTEWGEEEIGYWGNIYHPYTRRESGELAIETLLAGTLPRLHMLGISILTDAGLSNLATSPLAARLDRIEAPWLTETALLRYLDHPNTARLRGLTCDQLIEHPKLEQLDEVISIHDRGAKRPASVRRFVTGRPDVPMQLDPWTFRSIG